MKISVDAGALCGAHRFGTHVITQNILEALGRFDKQNDYTGYLYKRTAHLPTGDNLRYKVLRPSLAWMSLRVSFEEMMRPKDVYLGLSQAIPWFSKAKLLAFMHGLSFHFHKELYPDSYEALKDQVMFATSRAHKVIVSSSRVQQELSDQFGHKDSIVLPFGIPFDMEAVGKSKKTGKPYFLFVGMNHRIKNIEYLVQAFTIFKEQSSYKDFELLLVGNHDRFAHSVLGIRSIQVDRSQLRDLYRNAAGYLSASLYESFNLPVLEALSQDCPVIGKSSSIIPEFRSFVKIADKIEDFVDNMRRTVASKNVEHRDDVLRVFNFERYVTKLTKIYQS